jgi:O-antigen/teichoic acid export membrane protein
MPDSSTSPVRSLTAQTFHGVVWNAAGTILRQGIAFASSIVVTRQMMDEDYAVAGLAAAIVGVFTAISAQGFATALVREPELKPSQCHSVFYFLIGIGLVLGTLMVIASPIFAVFYGQPLLPRVMPVLAAALVITLAGSVPDALLTRAMRFREKNIIGVVGTLITAALAITLALGGFGYWALIVPGLGATLALSLGAFWVSGYRPRGSFHWSEVRSVGKFGSAMLGATLLDYLCNNGDYLIMGRFWPKPDFGQYYFAFERAKQPFEIVAGQIAGAVYPAFSHVQHDIDRVRRAYLRGTRLLSLLTLPLYVLLLGLADPVVPWIFGQQWQPAVPVFQVFSIICFMRTFAVLVSAPLLAMNCAHIAFYFNLFRISISLPALLCLGLFGAGIVTTAIVLVAIWLLQTPVFIGYLYWKIRLSWRDFWNAFGRVLSAAFLMGIMLVGIRFVASMSGWADWIMVPVAVGLSSGLFLLLLMPIVTDLINLVRTSLAER